MKKLLLLIMIAVLSLSVMAAMLPDGPETAVSKTQIMTPAPTTTAVKAGYLTPKPTSASTSEHNKGLYLTPNP